MELWEHPVERYLALGSLVVIAVSLAILAGKRLTEPSVLILETPNVKPKMSRPSLKVHVKGAVQKPSVYTLPFGSRVIDAVQKAQPKPDADLNAINLADFLEDGQEILVPSKNRLKSSHSLSLPPSSLAFHQPTPKFKSPSTIVHLNTATEEELTKLPGIGPVLAKRIIEHRRKIGGFKSVDQLLEVKGIGEKKLEQIRHYILP
ncbi:MAG: ComEA family DNA-binding protein [Candidatus Fervidibacter sp.]|uniref:ComEA family DNA-binding protein n=1 Tax=Candidatus Fervidibacter sp. TaxID=3100871 RepID=UPI004049E61A